jgi:hypothetical protein
MEDFLPNDGHFGGRESSATRPQFVARLSRSCDREWANSAAFVTLVLTACVVLILIPVFWLFGYEFSNVDSLYYLSGFVASRHFGTLLDLQSFAFGQGFGAFQHPTVLNVFWWVFDWSDSVQLAYIFTELSVFACVLTFAFWLSRNLLVAIVSGFLTVAIFFIPRLFADHFGPTMPQHILQIGLCYLALALVGFGLPRRVFMAAGFAVLVYVAMMDWLYLVFVLPLLGLGLAALCLTLIFDGWKTHWASLVSVVLVGVLFAVFLYLSGIKEAYDAFTLMAERAWIPGGVLPEFPLSLVMFGGVVKLPAAYIVGALSIVAMIYFLATSRGHVFFLSLLVLGFLAVLVAADIDSTGKDIYWTLPAIGYFERPLIPFYAIVIVYAASDCLERLLARIDLKYPLRAPAASRWRLSSFIMTAMASCAIATVLIGAWLQIGFGSVGEMVYRPAYYWERATQFVRALPFRRQSDRSFQPYFYDATRQWSINNCAHLWRDPWDAGAVRFCGLLLNIMSVPNFLEFQNLVDLQTSKLYGQATLPPEAVNAPSSAAFDRLRSLGIRYVVVDGKAGAALETLQLGGQQVSFIDLGSIEPKDLSIRSLLYDPVYHAAEVMAARERHVAVVHDEAAYRNGPLAPVTQFDMTYRPGGAAVHVKSAGDSVVLLPFQFSHCLRLAGADRGDVDLIMVNGGQAALRFAGEVNVEVVNALRYFGNAGCRRQDFISVFRHGIWPVQTIDDLAHGRRIPFLMKRYLDARFRYRDHILRSKAEP